MFVASIFGSGEARRGSIPRSGAVTEEQRSQNRKATQPSGRRFFLTQTSLLTPYRPLKGMRGCPCGSTSRLVWAKNPSPQTWSYLWNGVLRLTTPLRLETSRAPDRGVSHSAARAGPEPVSHHATPRWLASPLRFETSRAPPAKNQEAAVYLPTIKTPARAAVRYFALSRRIAVRGAHP